MGGCSSAGKRNKAQNPKDAALESLLNDVEYMESSQFESSSSVSDTSQQQDISVMIKKHSQLLTYIEKKMHKVYGEIHLISMLLPNTTSAEAIILAVQEKKFTSRLEYEYELSRLNELKDCSNEHSNLLGILALFSSDSRRTSADDDNFSSFDLCSGNNRNKRDYYDNPTSHTRNSSNSNNTTTSNPPQHRILLVTEYLSRDLATETFIRSLNISNTDIQPPLDHGYTESELLFIIKSLVSPLAYLQLQEKHHGSLKSDLVFITNDGTIQLALPKIIPTLPAYALLISGNLSQSQGGYLSPLLAEGVTNHLQLPQHNKYKSDVFSLGVMILETAYLKRMDRLYRFNTPSAKLDRSYDNNVDSVIAGQEVDRNALEWLIEGLGRKYSEEIVNICKAMVSLNEEDRPDFLQLAQMLGLDQEDEYEQVCSREYDSTDEHVEQFSKVISSPSKDVNIQQMKNNSTLFRKQQFVNNNKTKNNNPFRSLTPPSFNLRTHSPYRYIQTRNGKSSTSSEILITNNLAADNYYDNSNSSSGKDQNLRISTNSSRIGSATKGVNINDRYQQEEQLLDSSHLPSFNYSVIDQLPTASPIRPSDIQHIKPTSFVLHPIENNNNNNNTNSSQVKQVSSNIPKTHNNSMLSGVGGGDITVNHNESEFLDRDRSEGWMGYKTPQYSLAGISQQNQLTSPTKPPLPQQSSNHKSNGNQSVKKQQQQQLVDRIGNIQNSSFNNYIGGNQLIPERHNNGLIPKRNAQNSSSSDVRCLTLPDQRGGHSARTPSPISSKSLRNLKSMQQTHSYNNINKTNNTNINNTHSKVSKIIGLIAGQNQTSKNTINSNMNQASKKITTNNNRKQPGMTTTTTSTTVTVEIASKIPSKTSRLGTDSGLRTTKINNKPLEEKQQGSYKQLEKDKQNNKQQQDQQSQVASSQAGNAVQSSKQPWSSRFQLPFTPSPTHKQTPQENVQEYSSSNNSNNNTNLLSLPAKLRSNEITKKQHDPLNVGSFATPSRSTTQFNKSQDQLKQHQYIQVDKLISDKKHTTSDQLYPHHVRAASSVVPIQSKNKYIEYQKTENQSSTNKSVDLLTVEDTLNYIRNHITSRETHLNNRYSQSQTQLTKFTPISRYDDLSTKNHPPVLVVEKQPQFSINTEEVEESKGNNRWDDNVEKKNYNSQELSNRYNNNNLITNSNYNNNSNREPKNYIDPQVSKLISHHSRALSSEPFYYTRASTEPSADYSLEILSKSKTNALNNPINNNSSDQLIRELLQTKETKEKTRESITDSIKSVIPEPITTTLPPVYNEQKVQKILEEITSPNRFSNDKLLTNKNLTSQITASLLRTSSSNLKSSYITQQPKTPLNLEDTLELQRLKESATNNNSGTLSKTNGKIQYLDQLPDRIIQNDSNNTLANTAKDINSSKPIADTFATSSSKWISQNLLPNKEQSLSPAVLAPISSFVPVFTNEITFPLNSVSQITAIKLPTAVHNDYSTSTLQVLNKDNNDILSTTYMDIKPKDAISQIGSFAPLQQPLGKTDIIAHLDFKSQTKMKDNPILSLNDQPSSQIKSSNINNIIPSLISPELNFTQYSKQSENDSKKQWTPQVGIANITTNIPYSINGFQGNSIQSQYSDINKSQLDPLKSNIILESKLPDFSQKYQEKNNYLVSNQLDNILPQSTKLDEKIKTTSTMPVYIPYYNTNLNNISNQKVDIPSLSSSTANDNKLKIDSNIQDRLIPSVGLNYQYNYLEHQQEISLHNNDNIIPKVDGQKQSYLPFQDIQRKNDSELIVPFSTQQPSINSSDNALFVEGNSLSEYNNQKNNEKQNKYKPNINLSPLIEGLNDHSESDTPEILVNSNAYLSPVSLSKRLENQQKQEQQQQQFLVNSTNLREKSQSDYGQNLEQQIVSGRQQNFFESISNQNKEISNGLDSFILPQKQSIVEDHVTRQELNNNDENIRKQEENSQNILSFNPISATGTQFSGQINLFERYNGNAVQNDGNNPQNTPSSASKLNQNNEISSFSLTSLHSSDDPRKIERYEDGSYYEGEKLDGMRHGTGKFCYGDGGSYEGDWQYGHMSGYGLLYYPSGQKAYQGNWVNDKFNGLGIIFNENPQHLSGSFDCKDMSNLGDYWVRYEGQFSEDYKQGKGTIYLTNGERFEGHFEDDLIHGVGSFFRKDQTQVVGEWAHNVYKEGSGNVKDNYKYE